MNVWNEIKSPCWNLRTFNKGRYIYIAVGKIVNKLFTEKLKGLRIAEKQLQKICN